MRYVTDEQVYEALAALSGTALNGGLADRRWVLRRRITQRLCKGPTSRWVGDEVGQALRRLEAAGRVVKDGGTVYARGWWRLADAPVTPE